VEVSDREQVAFSRRRICLPRGREELIHWLEQHPQERDSEVVTMWWDVSQAS
jgi:hypothetical protein